MCSLALFTGTKTWKQHSGPATGSTLHIHTVGCFFAFQYVPLKTLYFEMIVDSEGVAKNSTEAHVRCTQLPPMVASSKIREHCQHQESGILQSTNLFQAFEV